MATTGAQTADTSTHINPAVTLIALTALAVATLLWLPVVLPIGPMYWDTSLYLDATNRIWSGQIPAVDFFIPAGPLGYYLAALFFAIFPNGHPVLIASWSVLIVTLPLMAVVAWEVSRRSRMIATLLVVPFLIYSFLPFNTSVYYPFAGADGFGIYNRQSSQLLYVLMAALIAMRDQRLLAVIVTGAMFALFGVKITGFLSGGLLCLFALLTGRVSVRTAATCAVAFLAVVGAVEAATGMISAYLRDIALLISLNQDGLALRLVQAASRTAGPTLAIIGLGGVLFLADWPAILADARKLGRDRSFESLKKLLDRHFLWLAVALLAAWFFESQNTGSQELIFVWPVIIMLSRKLMTYAGRPTVMFAVALLAASAVLPPLVNTVHHSSRALVRMARQTPLAHQHLGTLGAITAEPRVFERRKRMRASYLAYPKAMTALAKSGELHSFLLFADFDFQLGLLQTADEAVVELKRREAAGFDYQTVMTLDFTNPFPWLLDKRAPRHIAIGADPWRAVPPLDEETRQAVREADLVLEPQCPYSANVAELREIYAEALSAHRGHMLTPCYRVYVHPELEDAFVAAADS
ncbi:hypothetical protein [Oricola cellulosilytica]|uniref:Glycosyltransferase RgtA/B/C/D-like domain-containing protein n=1 Tax=Oricola cellulosilytica TaxID=1429082 RepID=A0A4R0PC77_9HYPH|nr:hypothetical protein [Oricola cellulosilytica]TCD15060.1 hypothetical protein E0D97_05805 [Oricola cellulosilytica]